MLVFDGIYKWEGWGGKLLLGSGSCRLRIFNIAKDSAGSLTHLRPVILVVSDVPESNISVRSCPGHIVTGIAGKFGLDYHRMTYIEHYPATAYGDPKTRKIAERYEIVEFTWQDDKAVQPKWRPLKPPLLDTVNRLVKDLQ